MKLSLYTFLALFFLMGCKSKQEVVVVEEAPRPNWVSSKPIEPGMYAGVGMAYKSAGADYIAIAKNNALNDLASEISVNISSSSLFYQIEQDNTLREEFQANTRLKSKESLVGYQLVANYENANEYWVFYELNKEEYQAVKQKRLDDAVGLSKQLFTSAKQFEANGQYAECIKFEIKAIAALRDYMAEPIQTEWNGNQVFWLPELYSALQNTVSSISLSPENNVVKTKRGQALANDELIFYARSPKGKTIAGLPIYLYYSGSRIQNNQLYTNGQGEVKYALQKVVSVNSKEYVQANVNMVALVSEATDDAFIRKLLGKISGAEARIEITIEKSKVYIESTEQNLSKPMANQLMAAAFKQQFVEEGFEITTRKSSADYILEINADTRETGQQQKLILAALDASISFYNGRQNLLYQKPVQGFVGIQTTAEKAGEDAYRKLAEEIEKRYFREMRRKVFD